MTNFTVHPPALLCGAACKPILRALPEWFGIEESTLQYIKDADTMPTLLVQEGEEVVGFLTINHHFPASAEIHCIAVIPRLHRAGVGRLLVDTLENFLREQHVKFLQVKTLSEKRICEPYAKTREFYKAIGFVPLEMFPTLWDEKNPCLLMVKSLV